MKRFCKNAIDLTIRNIFEDVRKIIQNLYRKITDQLKTKIDNFGHTVSSAFTSKRH